MPHRASQQRIYEDLLYVIVGSGGHRPHIERKIEDLGLLANVKLAGFVASEELPDYYAACDVFVLNSSGAAFPLVVE